MAIKNKRNINQPATPGVKTAQGKEITRFNALTHGILRKSLTEYENDFYSDILKDLQEEYQPQGVIEQMLLERIALSYLKLFRVQKAETEYLKSQFNPRVIEDIGAIEFHYKVIKKGYIPTMKQDYIETLSGTYSRYETTIENRLFRALHELERVQRARRGENTIQPLVVDVSHVNSFGENVSEGEQNAD